jgi:hypothetical protein
MPPLDIFRYPETVQFLREHEAARHANAAAKPDAAKSADTPSTVETAFEDLLDIVNPLQHLPVVGTLYRALTGDKIGTVEKIAGDTLYGGLWGAVGSLADTAFEAITGKDFGSTVLAMVTGSGDHPVAVARNAPAQKAAPSGSDVMAFNQALAAKGVSSDLSARALYAYRRSQGLIDDAAALN